MKSILDITVSCFDNCQSTASYEVNLLDWLTSNRYQARVEHLRTIRDDEAQKFFKASLPAITPSGVFSYRSEKNLIEHTGFLAFDVDEKDNRHLSNFDKFKEQISNIVCVAYCGISVRGKGYWGLIPIPKSTPEEHRYRFAALSIFFKSYGIVIDESGKDICRLRICSWDPEAYYNHLAKLYPNMLKPAAKETIRPFITDSRTKVEAIIEKIKINRIDITQDYKEEWLKIASALANEFGEAGRGYFQIISQYHPQYSELKTDIMFDNVLKHDYCKISIGSFFKIADDYGIKAFKNRQPRGVTSKQNDVRTLNESEWKTCKTKSDTVITRIERNSFKPVNNPAPHTQETWNMEIAELEKFFSMVNLPREAIKLNDWSRIADVSLFVESTLAFVKNHNGNKTYRTYMDQLIELKSLLSSI